MLLLFLNPLTTNDFARLTQKAIFFQGRHFAPVRSPGDRRTTSDRTGSCFSGVHKRGHYLSLAS